MLTEGTLTPLTLQSWTLACKRYMKHGGVKPVEIVSHVAEAMMEPRLIQWYQADQARIDALTLDAYIAELADLALERNWSHKMREEILSSRQGDREFMDWKVEIENKNAILATSAAAFSLTKAALKSQLEANLNAELRTDLASDPIAEPDLAKWSNIVKGRDEKLRLETKKIQKAIADNNAVRALRRNERTLASRLSSPPPTNNSTSQRNNNRNRSDAAQSTTTSTTEARRFLPALTDAERTLLDTHKGCTRCRVFYAGHRSDTCPLKATGSWPDAETYRTLTAAMARAAAPADTTRTTAAFAVADGASDTGFLENTFYGDDDTDSD